MSGEGEPQVPPVVAPVIEAGTELTAPVIDHTEKITRIEERQAQHEERLMRELGELESRLSTARDSEISAIREHIARVESKLEELARPVEQVPETVEDTAVELAEPEVESSPAPPEKVRRGIRHRKRARRKG